MALPDIFYDGNFDTPIEVEGSGLVSTDDITKGLIITRKYVIKASSYVPLPQGTRDRIYNNAYLVNETADQRRGPLVFFTRLFYQLPPSRTEPRSVSFTILGKSSVDYSAVTGLPIGWNQYGAAQPNTRNVNGFADFSYAIDPLTFGQPPITRNTYLGAPVDYMGFVYAYRGNVVVSDALTEPRWHLVGATFYTLMPALWIQEVNVTRFRGPIWQMEVVRVLPYLI